MVYKNHSSLVDYLGQMIYRKTNPYEKEFLAKETSPIFCLVIIGTGYLSRLFDCLTHLNLSAVLATDQI